MSRGMARKAGCNDFELSYERHFTPIESPAACPVRNFSLCTRSSYWQPTSNGACSGDVVDSTLREDEFLLKRTPLEIYL